MSAAQGGNPGATGSRPVTNGNAHGTIGMPMPAQRSGEAHLGGGQGQAGGFSSQNLNGIVSDLTFSYFIHAAFLPLSPG